MSLIILNVDEVRRTLSASGGAFVDHDKKVDIVRFAINSGFADIVLDGQVALRVMYQRPGETEVRAQTLTYYDTDGLHNYYDWQLSQSDLAKNGSLMVALCILDISGGEVSEWHTTPCAVRVLDTIHTDDSDKGDDTITPTVKERVAVLETMIQRVASGAPIVVSSTSAMTDTNQIYVLSTDGNWYYHNGTSWVAGGTYGAVSTDTTLTQSGIPADAGVTGEEIGKLHNSVDSILSGDFGTSGIEFEKGGMEAGSSTTYRKACRLRTKEIAILPYDLTVKIVSANTLIRIYGYEDGVYVRGISEMSVNGASYTIPANTEFRFFVDGRNGLATSELTVEELLSKFEMIVDLMGLEQVTNAISILNSNIDMIPDYYFENDYLQNKARTAQLASGVEGISFGFITDIHTGDNVRNSMKLAKYIADKTTALPFIICGGDIPETNTGSEDGLYEQAQYWQEMMAQYGKHNVYQCRGNHDYLTKLSGNASFNASNGVCFSYVMGNQPYSIHPSAKGKMSYYFDVDASKIRFIILDEYDVSNTNPDADFSSYVGLSPAQYHWLVDEALNVDGYDVVIVVHQPLNIVDDPSYISNLDLLRDIIAAFNAHEQFSGSWGATTINVDFSTYTSNLVCVLSGHKHIDTSGDTGFLNIVTTSDALYTSDGYGRQAGTVSEGAFDIVSIDTNNRIINCTRIGGGYDRQFTY